MPIPVIVILCVVAILAICTVIYFSKHSLFVRKSEITPKTLEYSNELEDDFGSPNIKQKEITENYKYINKNLFYRIIEIIYYRIIVIPIAFTYCKLIMKIKYINKSVLKKAKKTGYFVYANHTNNISDAFSPPLICQPLKPYIVVNSKNLNMPVLKGSTKMLGAIPLPTGLSATRNYMDALQTRLNEKSGIIIYPEAHIWPYYTKIRNFKPASFKYPIKFNVPSFCFTTVYLKKKNPKKFKTIIYIDGPFYPNEKLSGKEQVEELRNQVYNTMVERSKLNNFEKIIYIKKEHTND